LRCAQEEAEYDKAILLHQQTLAIKKKALGDEHLSISTTIGDPGSTHLSIHAPCTHLSSTHLSIHAPCHRVLK
jgi:hypothetical protein